MDNKTSYGLKKQLYSPNMNRIHLVMYVTQNPYKTDIYIWKWTSPRKGEKYAPNLWKKNMKNDLRSF